MSNRVYNASVITLNEDKRVSSDTELMEKGNI